MTIDLLTDLSNGPLVARAGWTLVHFIWQGALVALLLAAALRVMRRRTPQARYAAGLAALFAMAMLPVLTWSLLPAPVPPVAQAVSQDAPYERTMLVASVPPPSIPPAAVETASETSWIERMEARLAAVLPYAVLGWLIGVLVLGVRLLGGIAHIGRLRRRDAHPVAAQWRRRFAALARRMGVRRSVRLLTSNRAEGPLALGGWHPVVLMPGSLLTGLPPEQVEAILAHELAHLRRWDYEVNLLQSILEIALFYHPAVWWVSRRVRQAREHCCDDLAADASRSHLTYARALTELEALRGPTLAPGASDGSLVARIRRLMESPAPPRPNAGAYWIIGAFAALALGAGVLAACASTSRSSDTEHAIRTTAAVTDTSAAPVFADTTLAADLGVRVIISGDTLPMGRALMQIDTILHTPTPMLVEVDSIRRLTARMTPQLGEAVRRVERIIMKMDTLDIPFYDYDALIRDSDTIEAYSFYGGRVEIVGDDDDGVERFILDGDTIKVHYPDNEWLELFDNSEVHFPEAWEWSEFSDSLEVVFPEFENLSGFAADSLYAFFYDHVDTLEHPPRVIFRDGAALSLYANPPAMRVWRDVFAPDSVRARRMRRQARRLHRRAERLQRRAEAMQERAEEMQTRHQQQMERHQEEMEEHQERLKEGVLERRREARMRRREAMERHQEAMKRRQEAIRRRQGAMERRSRARINEWRLMLHSYSAVTDTTDWKEWDTTDWEEFQEQIREMREQAREMRQQLHQAREHAGEMQQLYQVRQHTEDMQGYQRRPQWEWSERQNERREVQAEVLREIADALEEQADVLRQGRASVEGDTHFALENRRLLREQIRILEQQARSLRLRAERLEGQTLIEN